MRNDLVGVVGRVHDVVQRRDALAVIVASGIAPWESCSEAAVNTALNRNLPIGHIQMQLVTAPVFLIAVIAGFSHRGYSSAAVPSACLPIPSRVDAQAVFWAPSAHSSSCSLRD